MNGDSIGGTRNGQKETAAQARRADRNELPIESSCRVLGASPRDRKNGRQADDDQRPNGVGDLLPDDGSRVHGELAGSSCQTAWKERWPSLAASVSDCPPEGCGLYFLIRDGDIVYIGSSTYPSKRVWVHQHGPEKNFTEFVFLAVEEERLIETERHWIGTICPVHNKQYNPRRDDRFPGWGKFDPTEVSCTITFTCDPIMAMAFEQFQKRQRVPPARHKIITTALREFLEREGYFPPSD